MEVSLLWILRILFETVAESRDVGARAARSAGGGITLHIGTFFLPELIRIYYQKTEEIAKGLRNIQEEI